MHCRSLTQYAIIMVQFLAGLRKIKLPPAPPNWQHLSAVLKFRPNYFPGIFEQKELPTQ